MKTANKTIIASTMATLMLASTFVGVSAATAADGPYKQPDTVREVSGQHDGIYVIDGDGETFGDGATFYELPESAKGALIITPEVAKDLGLRGGQVAKTDESRVLEMAGAAALASTNKQETTTESQASTMAALASDWTNFVAPLGGGWSPAISRGTVHNHVSEKYYNFYVDPFSYGSACGQGSGYYTGYNGGSFGLWKNWYGLGCGTSGGGRVPWDNVMAYPEFMARAMQVYLYVPGAFA